MSIRCRDIADYIEEIAPAHLAEEWDNVGLLLGDSGREVKSILLCLDITGKVAEEAASRQVDMIISHHPLIFSGLKRILRGSGKGDVLYSLIKNDICVLSAHTNLDVVPGGVNDCLACVLGLQNLQPLKKYHSDTLKEAMEGTGYGLGRTGRLANPMNLPDFIQQVKVGLRVDNVRLIGRADRRVERVGVFCGSFDDDLKSIRNAGVDVLVTGDVKYHTAQDAVEMGLCLLDAGHFSTEVVVLPYLERILKERFPGIEIAGRCVETDPFNYY